jgi:hypothetical protein
MGEERLSGIALLNIERNFEINLDQIVTDFIVNKYENLGFKSECYVYFKK